MDCTCGFAKTRIRLPALIGVLSCALALAGCDATADPVAADGDPLPIAETIPDIEELAPDTTQAMPDSPLAPGFAPLAFDLSGTGWLITAIDGVPTADLQDDIATVHFGQGFLRWRGCNMAQALYIPLKGSFALGEPETVDAGCSASEVDAAMAQVLAGKPLIGRNREGKIMLAVPDHSLVLSAIDSGPKDPAAPPLNRAPFVMLAPGAPDARPVLSLQEDGFTIWMDCPDAITGRLRLVDGRLRTAAVKVSECDSFRPTARESLAGFFRSSPWIARGGDGQLLLSDGATVIAARQCHPDATACKRSKAAIHSAESDGGEETEPAPGR